MSLLAWPATVVAQGEAPRATETAPASPEPPTAPPEATPSSLAPFGHSAYTPPTLTAPHVGYWASVGLEFLAARAVHPYVGVEGGLPITRAISLQVLVLLAEGVRDFYDWSRPDYDWTAAAIVPGLVVETTVHAWDGHYLTLGCDAGFGVHVLQANLPDSGETRSIAGLGRAAALLRLVVNNGLMLQVAPLGFGVLADFEQVHLWYEGSFMLGFRWP